MEPIRDDEFSHLSFLHNNPLAFYETFLDLRPAEETGLVYYSIPSNDWLWKERFLAALEGKETFRFIDSESIRLDHPASRYLIWEDVPVKETAPKQKKPWVQMNEQYLRRAHRGRSKHKRR